MASMQIFEESYKITSFLVNLRGQAGLYAILNLIQDVGFQHATALKVRLEKNQGWVFTRQKLVMNEWPAWNETLTIRTWLRPPVENFLFRDYEILLQGRKIGECTSTFTVMDMSTRKLAQVDWSPFAAMWRTDHALTHQPEKIPAAQDVDDLAQFQVRNSDIDLNRHVNNTKYAQWVLDAIPIDILRAGVELKSCEVNFLAETKTGDIVTVQKTHEDELDGDAVIIHFQGLRTHDRKPAFTVRMRTIPTPRV